MRRFFLTLLTAGTLACTGLMAQKGKAPFTGEIGLQTYTFRNGFPQGVEATLDTIKSLGFVELEANPPKGVTHAEFRKMTDARGLKIVGTGADYNEIVKDPMAVVQNARTLGAKFVMVASIPHKGPFKLDDAMRAAEDFNRVGKVLKENGITFCYHNHGFEFTPHGTGTLFDYMVENTNPEYVSFELDILWAIHPGADPAELLKKYGSRFKLMHLKDLKKGVKGDLSGSTPKTNDVALGTGQAKFPAIMRAAEAAGIRHYFIEDESPSYMQQIPKSVAYLNGLK
ncbi:sugar phosphate isomerase/epimerase [Ravibacter arvi]|uniref:Sugar phosphate isomerase/epimerase n=1 Tax=Ravibacter arvi TaxID=2051041 RepID=A0ABP8MA05_9BACT